MGLLAEVTGTISILSASQLEDVTDCLKVLYPTYNFEGHFDHFLGHEKRIGAALDAADMNLGYGGAQCIMQDTIIEHIEGFLGNFDPLLLNVGDVQHMVYQAQDAGPFHMTAEEHIDRRFNQQSGNMTIYKKNMSKLKIELAGKGLQESAWKGKKQAELHAMCISHGIVINKQGEIKNYYWLVGETEGVPASTAGTRTDRCNNPHRIWHQWKEGSVRQCYSWY